MKITRKEFIETYKKHKPNTWIKFMYRYFSDENHEGSFLMRDMVSIVFLILFFIGFIGMIFFNENPIIMLVTIIYTILLLVLVLSMLIAVIMNFIRINRIIKKLNISKEYYNILVRKYLLN